MTKWITRYILKAQGGGVRMDWLKKLKEMKKQSGKTSKEISEATGIPKSTIDKLFSGQTKEPYLSSVRAIVHYLGYTLDDLEEQPIKKAPAKGESDFKKQRLIHNYDQLNELGQDTLVNYSDDIASMPKYTDELSEDKKQA